MSTPDSRLDTPTLLRLAGQAARQVDDGVPRHVIIVRLGLPDSRRLGELLDVARFYTEADLLAWARYAPWQTLAEPARWCRAGDADEAAVKEHIRKAMVASGRWPSLNSMRPLFGRQPCHTLKGVNENQESFFA